MRGSLILLVFVQVLFVTMACGSIAAYLVAALRRASARPRSRSPTTSASGVLGDLLPLIEIAVVASTGNLYADHSYPMAVAALAFVVGSPLPEQTHWTLVWSELESDKRAVT